MIKTIFRQAWALWKKHILFTWIILGILWGFSLFFGLIEAQFPEESLARSLISLISFATIFFLELGVISIVLQLVRTGQEAPLESLFSQRDIYWRALGANLLYYLAIAIGLVLLIVPGIYIAVRFYFLNYVLVDRKLPFREAFREASHLSEGHRWQFVGFMIVLVLLNLAGALLLLVGLAVTIPLTMLATVYFYEALSKEKGVHGAPEQSEEMKGEGEAPKDAPAPIEPTAPTA